jgi:GTPase SAR1 family protein
MAVSASPTKAFSWSTVLGDTLQVREVLTKMVLNEDGEIDDTAAQVIETETESLLRGKYVGLYFSGEWCPPSAKFTPVLAKCYESIKSRDVPFEIVFISSDRSEKAQMNYYNSLHGPWAMLPASKKKINRDVSSEHDVNSIPSLIIFDPEGNIVTKKGRGEVQNDTKGLKFPWSPGAGINRDGVRCLQGQDGAHYYCGEKVRSGSCPCGGCDDYCGPGNGCPCEACMEYYLNHVENPPASALDEITMSGVYQSALRDGKVAAWLRSRLMIVGEGRVGKTSLLNSLRGDLFTEETSTQGTAISGCVLDHNDLNQWKKLTQEQEGHQLEKAMAHSTLIKRQESMEKEDAPELPDSAIRQVSDRVEVRVKNWPQSFAGTISSVNSSPIVEYVHHGKSCHQCGQNPIIGDRHHSDGTPMTEKRELDFCPTCWAKVEESAPPEVIEKAGFTGPAIQGEKRERTVLTYDITFDGDEGVLAKNVSPEYVKTLLPEDEEKFKAKPKKKIKIAAAGKKTGGSRKGRRHSLKSHPSSSMEYDKSLVSTYIKDGHCQNLTISAWDYGGQEVFYSLHHLFLTRYGVYLVVFNMEHLNTDDENVRNQCTRFLKFWLQSIYIHARSCDAGVSSHNHPVAPIFLIGTRKDIVRAPEDQERISTMLDTFIQKLPRDIDDAIVQQEGSSLKFWPINNKSRLKVDDPEDPLIVSLRKAIESAIHNDPSEYAHISIPYKWLEISDYFKDKVRLEGLNFVTFDEFVKEANSRGVTSKAEVTQMLLLFHQLGILVYFKEPSSVSNTVVLNPQWLIDVVSKIICDYQIHGSIKNALMQIFDRFDSNHDGHIEAVELVRMLESFAHDDLPHHDDALVQEILGLFDTGDVNGSIEPAEFVNKMLQFIVDKRKERRESSTTTQGIFGNRMSLVQDILAQESEKTMRKSFVQIADAPADMDEKTYESKITELKSNILDARAELAAAMANEEEDLDETLFDKVENLTSELRRSIRAKSRIKNKAANEQLTQERWKKLSGGKGILHLSLLPILWKTYSKAQWIFLISLMEKFGLICQLWKPSEYLVPCLLGDEPVGFEQDEIPAIESYLQFRFTFLPSGFFERLQAAAVRRSHMFKNGENVLQSSLSLHSINLTFGIFHCKVVENRSEGVINAFVSKSDEVGNNDGYVMFRYELTKLMHEVDAQFFKERLYPVQHFLWNNGKKSVPADGVDRHGCSRIWGMVEKWFEIFDEEDIQTRGCPSAPTPCEGENVTKPPDEEICSRGGRQRTKSTRESITVDAHTNLEKLIPRGKNGARVAVIFTIDDYGTECPLKKLKYATKDGNRIKEVLEKKFGYEILCHKIDSQCTNGEIVNVLKDVEKRFEELTAANSENGSSFVFYFAGHGDLAGPRQKEGVCCLHGYNHNNWRDTSYKLKDLQRKAEDLEAKMQLWIFDACHTGQIFKKGKINVPQTQGSFEKDSNYVNEHTAVYALTACRDNQESIEIPSKKHGLFTATLCEKLEAIEDSSVRSMNDLSQDLLQSVKNYINGQSNANAMDPCWGLLIEEHKSDIELDGEFLFISSAIDVANRVQNIKAEMETLQNRIEEIQEQQLQYELEMETSEVERMDEIEIFLDELCQESTEKSKKRRRLLKLLRKSNPTQSNPTRRIRSRAAGSAVQAVRSLTPDLKKE